MDRSRHRAAIELHGRVMRYAEVDLGEQGPGLAPAPRLVRLGACDFEFDVADAVLDLSGPTHLDTVARAVGEIFDGSQAQTLHVAVPPWRAASFFAPLPEGMSPTERFEQLRQEAALLSDASVSRPVRIRATPVRIEALADGSEVYWHHVLRLSEGVHARLAHVAARLGGQSGEAGPEAKHEAEDVVGAAAAVVALLTPAAEEGPAEDEPFTLVMGVYGAHTAFALVRGRAWYFGHHVEAAEADARAYFAAALLDRLGLAPEQVTRFFLFGDGVQPEDAAGVEALLGREAVPLDPLRLFGLGRPGADLLVLSAFAPCVGAALR